MKAISLWQPWATLIAEGHKTIETRSWRTPYRGPIAIHAAKKWDMELETLSQSYPFAEALPLTELPLGCIVAVAELYDCVQVTPALLEQITFRHTIAVKEERLSEYFWGDYSEGRWMWRLKNIMKIEPMPAKGSQGIWDWDSDAAGFVLRDRVPA